jgi:UDP-N-acetylglucosamine--N-acetylmuramyl-(pentapeptide) pyrophosphoryl-undecaprenol N-acetylglucosamine transferase
MSGRFVILAAGGTGGHVFPAEALAGELLNRNYRLAVVTDRRGQAYGGTLGQLATYRIRAGGIAGRSLPARLRALGSLAVGFLQATALLQRLKPDAVIGFGGYASVPTMLAAATVGCRTGLHEQNAVLGRANRLLARRVTRIATCYAQVRYLSAAWRGKTVQTGMPVRAPIIALRSRAYDPPRADGPIRLLVLGGSQGARVLSEVVPAALVRLADRLGRPIEVSQQCRPEDLDRVRQIYAGSGVGATLETFFQDVPQRLADSHLVIARAGASTVGELTVLGRPSILVPYPYAVDDHQTANAHAIDEAGGGWLMPETAFTAEGLCARLGSLFVQPDSLGHAAACARAVGVPDAAVRLADLIGTMTTASQGVAA